MSCHVKQAAKKEGNAEGLPLLVPEERAFPSRECTHERAGSVQACRVRHYQVQPNGTHLLCLWQCSVYTVLQYGREEVEWDRTMVWRKKGGIKKSLSAGDRESEAASFSTGEKERGQREGREGGPIKRLRKGLGSPI